MHLIPVASARLTPSESRAIARAIGRLISLVVQDLGWTWGLVALGGTALVGYAAWTAPMWWDWIRDWLDQ